MAQIMAQIKIKLKAGYEEMKAAMKDRQERMMAWKK
jgi:hypothetical protein